MSELVLINPRRRRRRRKNPRRGRMPPGLARYWAGKRRKLRAPRRHRARRRRRAVAINPRRHRRRAARGYVVGSRKIRRRKLNPRHRRHHARRRHRNPRFGLPSVRGVVRGTIMPAAIGATGAIALDVAMGYASPYLPAALQGKWAMLGVKLVGAIGLGMVAGKFLGRERGRIVTLGAATVVGYGALKSAVASALPTVPGLSGYADYVDYSMQSRGTGAYLPPAAPRMGFYSPAATIQNTGAYLRPPGMSGMDGMDGYNWQSDGM